MIKIAYSSDISWIFLDIGFFVGAASLFSFFTLNLISIILLLS